MLKTYLVADTKTLIAFNEASAAIAAAIIDLSAHRLAVQQVDDEIIVQRSVIERTQRFLDSMRDQIQTADLDIPTERTVQRVEWAAQQHGIASASLNEQIQKLDTLTNEHARRAKSLIERSIRINRDAQKPIRTALLAARSELEVKLDVKQFASAAADIDRRMSDKIQELLGLMETTSEDSSSRKAI